MQVRSSSAARAESVEMGLSDASAIGLLHGSPATGDASDAGSDEASRLRGELAKARRKIEALERAVRRQATAQSEREQRLVNLRDVAVEELRREIARLAAEKPTERSEPVSALSIEEQLARSIMRQRSAPKPIAPAVIAAEPAAPRGGAFQRALQDIDALDRLVRDLQFKRARAQIKEDEAKLPAQDVEARRRAEIEIIRASGLFDAERYVKKVPGVADPIARYVQGGLDEDAAPHPIFANRWYVARHAKHLVGWLTPFAHFLDVGWRKSLDPHPLFKTRWYLAQNEDVKMSGINPFVHFMTRGHREGRNPNPYFDTAWYRETYLFDSQTDANPLIHYFLSGKNGAHEPSPDFDTARLSEHYPRVGLAQTNALAFLLGLEDAEQEQAMARMRGPNR